LSYNANETCVATGIPVVAKVFDETPTVTVAAPTRRDRTKGSGHGVHGRSSLGNGDALRPNAAYPIVHKRIEAD
jgi:hypothetical protein